MKTYIIDRDKTNQKLQQIYNQPLYIVSAPMGYGKTTAVKTFLESAGGNTAWLSLYGSNVEEFFWKNLCSQIVEFDKQLSEILINNGTPKNKYKAANMVDVISGYVFKKRTVLVLDDFHMIEDIHIISFIKSIARKNINNLHIVIITRDLELKDFVDIYTLAGIMDARTLNFNRSDIIKLSHKFDMTLDEKNIHSIIEYSGGWASIIYLMLRGIKQGIAINKNSNIYMLIRNTIFESLDDDIKEGLIRLSFLDGFSHVQADYILGVKGFTARLLPHNIPFIQHHSDVFVIHDVLRNFLVEEGKVKAIDYQKNYNHAGEWFLRHEDYINAFEYYYLSDNLEEFFRNKTKSMPLFRFSERIVDALEKCDEDLYVEYPFSFLDIGSQLLLVDNEKHQALGGRIIFTLYETAQSDRNIFGEDTDRLLAEIHIINIFMSFNNLDKISEHLHKAIRLLNGKVSSVFTRDAEFTLGSPHFLYSYYREEGELKQTAETIAENMHYFPKISDGCGEGSEYVVMAEYYLETGDIANAEATAYKAIYKASSKDQIGLELCAVFVLLRINLIKGNMSEVDNLIDNIQKKVINCSADLYITTLDIIKGYIFSITNHTDKIPQWLLKMENMDELHRIVGMSFFAIVRSKVLLHLKDYNSLEVETQISEETFAVFNNRLGYLHNKIHIALLAIKKGDTDTSESKLLEAINFARADKIIMPFVEHGYIITKHMETLWKNNPDDTFVKDLYNHCKRYKKNIQLISGVKRITATEIDILKLMSQGKSREEIAKQLSISINTVKTHISNIYEKFGVNRKLLAINKAKDIGIID